MFANDLHEYFKLNLAAGHSAFFHILQHKLFWKISMKNIRNEIQSWIGKSRVCFRVLDSWFQGKINPILTKFKRIVQLWVTIGEEAEQSR